MNLLPKSSTEFGASQYWETFFKKRGSKAFEWYGEYPTLCGILHKYIRTNDRILHIGCGNSRITEDLYDVGYHQSVNVDIIDNVIKQMTTRNAKQRPEMKFEHMDVTKMTYEDASFSVVLDKGTLDALMPDEDEATCVRVEAMFAEIGRVLKVGGRYVCITLVQEHILRKVLDYFPNEGWMCRLQKVDKAGKEDASDKESPMPVFVIICTKFKKMGAAQNPILEVSLSEGRTPHRVSTKEEVMQAVKGQQEYAMLQHNLNKRSFCDESLSVDLFAPGVENPRFTLHIVDKDKGKTAAQKFAIFIVPQGRETEFLFGTDKGRGQLADQAGFQRLAVVTLHRGHKYDSISSIKGELSSQVMDLAPAGLPANTQVPFLSIGDDVGNREVRHQGPGSHGNEIIVEDVRGEDGGTYRQLFFSSNLHIVQSQAKLITEKARTKSGKKKGKLVTSIDHLTLCMAFHRHMVAGFALVPDCVDLLQGGGAKALVVGLGGGGLPMFLYKQFPKLELDVVELDPSLREIAKSWFGLVEDKRLRIHIQDGLDYIRTQAEKDSPVLYNAVLFDVDSKDSSQGLSCPPKAFLEPSVLDQVNKILHPQQGVFILNFACRDDALKEGALADMRKRFPTVLTSPLEDDINEIVHCLPQRTDTAAEQQRAVFRDSARALQKFARSVSARWESDFDLSEIMEELKINEER